MNSEMTLVPTGVFSFCEFLFRDLSPQSDIGPPVSPSPALPKRTGAAKRPTLPLPALFFFTTHGFSPFCFFTSCSLHHMLCIFYELLTLLYTLHFLRAAHSTIYFAFFTSRSLYYILCIFYEPLTLLYTLHFLRASRSTIYFAFFTSGSPYKPRRFLSILL